MPLPQLCEALGTDVLTRVLDPDQKIRDELMDGAFVLDGSGNTLRHFDLITLTVKAEKSLEQRDNTASWWSHCGSVPEVSSLRAQVLVHGVQ